MPIASTIAIDGPVASGKSAVGRLLAKKLGYRFLDTGSMYRGVTLAALARRIDLQDQVALGKLASGLTIRLVPDSGNGDKLLVDGEDVTSRLREPEVERTVSLVAQVRQVREAMVKKQRAMARSGGVVMAGRDIGTVVLPYAGLKVFLSASVEERARRRHSELKGLGQEVPYEQVLQEMVQRDRMDTERSHSPLHPASDAHVLNTDGIGIEGVVEKIMAMLEKG